MIKSKRALRWLWTDIRFKVCRNFKGKPISYFKQLHYDIFSTVCFFCSLPPVNEDLVYSNRVLYQSFSIIESYLAVSTKPPLRECNAPTRIRIWSQLVPLWDCPLSEICFHSCIKVLFFHSALRSVKCT